MPKETYALGRRNEIIKVQDAQIKQLYKEAAEEVADRAKFFMNRDNISSVLRTQYLSELSEQLRQRMESIDNKTQNIILNGMRNVSSSVVKENAERLLRMGFTNVIASTSYLYVPDDIVRELVSGKLYEGRWSLSRAIWSDNKAKLSEIDSIIAKGVAENKSTYEIANDLEKYVNPVARKPWDWGKVYPGSRKVIDYCAQRLSRTMVQHAYQESFVRVTKNNPFIDSYQWLASGGDRMCDLCAERDGKIYSKDELPLDHPNGMCTFVVVMSKSLEEVGSDLHDWMMGEGDEALNREIDKFANDLTKTKYF